MGSTDTDSTSELHKLYVEENLYVACAGRIELASEIISLFKQELAKLPSRIHGAIWTALNKAVHEHRMTHFQWDVIAPRHMFTPGEVFEKQHDKIIEEWQNYDLGLDMLVGTFHHSGLALLYLVGQVYDAQGQIAPGLVHSYAYPGFATIGTGGQMPIFGLTSATNTWG